MEDLTHTTTPRTQHHENPSFFCTEILKAMPPKTCKLVLDAPRPTVPPKPNNKQTDAWPLVQAPNGALIDVILAALVAKLDVDELAQLLVDQVTDRLVNSITLSDLAETIATQQRDEINTRLAQVVLARVGKKA